MKRSRSLIITSLTGVAVAAATLALAVGVFTTSAQAATQSASGASATHHPVYMGIRGGKAKGCHHHCGGGGSNNLVYAGGTGGVGVETGADQVYLVYWGSQWNGNDPSGEAAIQNNFFSHVGASSWNNTVTQYCEGVASGTVTCGGSGTPAANPSGSLIAGTWYDNAAAAPSSPTQAQIAAEAASAAAHFGNSSHTTVQYVINTASGDSMNGFATQWCAWHDYTSSVYGNIAYTYMPYITDAGASCGAGFNGLSQTAGITIVGGHEFAETETDIYPSSGWVDGTGSEIGDKCAWISSGQGASANVTMNGATFPVQSLWSNAFNSGAGGCVLSY